MNNICKKTIISTYNIYMHSICICVSMHMYVFILVYIYTCILGAKEKERERKVVRLSEEEGRKERGTFLCTWNPSISNL